MPKGRGGAWSRVSRHLPTVQGQSDERYTPDWLVEWISSFLGGIDLDPCADPKRRIPALNHFTIEENGLEQPWKGKVYLNPPFSQTSAWLRHLSIYVQSGAISEALVLLPVMSLTNRSARLLMHQASSMVLIEERLSFLNQSYEQLGKLNTFPFALVYVGFRSHQFLLQSGEIGIPCFLSKLTHKRTSKQCSCCGIAFQPKRSTAKYCSSSCRIRAHRKRNHAVS